MLDLGSHEGIDLFAAYSVHGAYVVYYAYVDGEEAGWASDNPHVEKPRGGWEYAYGSSSASAVDEAFVVARERYLARWREFVGDYETPVLGNYPFVAVLI
jgi:hypothetical protein